MYKSLALLAALLLFAAPCWSDESAPETDKPSLYSSQTVTVTAVVEAINHETREVTLRGPEGDTTSFVASEEARNLDQVSVGDIVTAEYEQSLSIEVFDNDGSAPGAGAIAAAGRSEKGEMPGMAAIDATVVTAIARTGPSFANRSAGRSPKPNLIKRGLRPLRTQKRKASEVKPITAV